MILYSTIGTFCQFTLSIHQEFGFSTPIPGTEGFLIVTFQQINIL